MKLNDELMEDFDYKSGDLETLKRRFFSLYDFVMANSDGATEDLKKLNADESLLDDPDALSDAIQTLEGLALETETDDEREWETLYTGLFDSSPYLKESHYIPKPGEMEDIVKLCIKKKKRIRTDLPDGEKA